MTKRNLKREEIIISKAKIAQITIWEWRIRNHITILDLANKSKISQNVSRIDLMRILEMAFGMILF